ncbi:1-acyl-sn-glycerol-3-phosphate acyltransferase [Polaribacter sp. Hel1_33_78]|nr:lysophospholipid acyltransferase family protein [Polaribacter sp. Hel1_33_78]MBT7815493.1 1-acyl-sn-glycerol-3-phosphate acyltransferase [Polaribacter sp.]SDU26761.1 1-acyl-sn-glycerol-3-phosphate acyltransferase [Polaribacter sp. Hel1_33_78]
MKILSYILSPLFLFTFILFLIIFHPLQWLSFNIFGINTHSKVVAILNYFLMKSLLIIGVTIRLKNEYKIPENTSIIFVSNHQSIVDIPPIAWFFRKHYPKFVAKIELAKGTPSVSYNLRVGGAALIDRKDPKQSISELIKFSKRINKNKWGAIIFPEGTRSRNGEPKKFASNGLKIITKFNKEGYVVPLTINNSWKIFKYGSFPFGIGSPITITTHKPIKIDSMPFEELLEQTESIIKEHIK